MGVNITAVVIQVHVSVGKVRSKADNKSWPATIHLQAHACVGGFEDNKGSSPHSFHCGEE